MALSIVQESVNHLSMVERTVMETCVKHKAAMKGHVLVSKSIILLMQPLVNDFNIHKCHFGRNSFYVQNRPKTCGFCIFSKCGSC